MGIILRLDVDPHQLVQRSYDLAGHKLNDEQLKKFLPDREQGYKICTQYPKQSNHLLLLDNKSP